MTEIKTSLFGEWISNRDFIHIRRCKRFFANFKKVKNGKAINLSSDNFLSFIELSRKF